MIVFKTSELISSDWSSLLNKSCLIFLKISFSLKDEEYKSIKKLAASKDICILISGENINFCK